MKDYIKGVKVGWSYDLLQDSWSAYEVLESSLETTDL